MNNNDNSNNNNNFTKVFTTIYEDKEWGISQNHNTSGTGDLLSNLPFLVFLELFLAKTNAKSLLDFGCGDWSIMKHINLPQILKYKGVDVVDSIIKSNSQKFGINENIKFYTIDNNYSQLLENKEFEAEVLLVKNIFENWPLDHITKFIQQVVPKFKYVIFATFYNPRGQNIDVPMGWFHTLNILDFEYTMENKIKFLFASEVFDNTFNAYYVCCSKLDNNFDKITDSIVSEVKKLKSRLIINNLQDLDEHINKDAAAAAYPCKINNMRKKYSIDKFIWGNNNQIVVQKNLEPITIIVAGFEFAQVILLKGFDKSFKLNYIEEGLYELSFNDASNKLFLYSFNHDIEQLMPYLLKDNLFCFD